jgi:tRNA1(Val) A37 N6-methylase TrmN6
MSHLRDHATGLTAGTLLDGSVAYAQPVDGYRTGLEPVLLAAAVPARQGDHVLEAGTGAGAGLLALAGRVSGLTGLGLELDPALASLAEANFAANFHQGLRVLVQDVTLWRSQALFDHAFANPPWHEAGGTPSPQADRRRAKIAPAGLLAAWTRALARRLRHRGTLSLILPASAMGEGIAALRDSGCPEISLFPLWKRAGEPARLVIMQARRLGKGPCRMLPGLVLHAPAGGLSDAAETVLRHGGKLDLHMASDTI